MISRAIVTALFSVLCILNLPAEGFGKEYAIPTIIVKADIRADGSVRITEHRTYHFEGSFSWADYRLPLQGYSGISNIRVTEADTDFINTNSEEPGSFQVLRTDDEIKIKWFYEVNGSQERTFTIAYTLEDAVVIGPEWAEFFWNYLSSEREKATDLLRIRMTLTKAVPGDSLYSWARGPQTQIKLENNEQGYQVIAHDLDDDEFVKIRSVFPRSVFRPDAVSTTDPTFTLANARADERAHQQKVIAEQKEKERYAGYGRQLAGVVSILSIAAFLFFYRTYGKRHSASHISSSETIMIPGKLKPAAAGWLLGNRTITSAHLMATLLDLARRNYFIIREVEAKKGWFGSKTKQFKIENTEGRPALELTEWEAELKTFISKQIDNGNDRIDTLFSESSYKASTWFSAWKKQVSGYCKSRGWYDKESYKGAFANFAVQLPLVAAAILAIVWAGPIGIIPLILAIGLAIGSIGIIRRTPEGEQAYKRWKAYREGLKNAKAYSIGHKLIGRHYIYSVAFGLSKKEIRAIFKQMDTANIVLPWVIFYGSAQPASADIAEAFSSLSATGTAAFPGAVSSGAAGASAGVAGGGAAGGAG